MKPFFNKNATFNFYLVDQNNDRINLHGVDFSFTLNIFTYTPLSNMFNKLSKYIDYKS